MAKPATAAASSIVAAPAERIPESNDKSSRTIQYRSNRILTALPANEFRRLAPHLTEIELNFKRPLYKPSEPIRHVCFPDSGVCSVLAIMGSGSTAEVGTIGNEGVAGVALYFGVTSDLSESMVQVPGRGRLLPARVFQAELARKATLSRLIGEYAHALIVQLMQSAGCNALHPIEQRACKWLLMTHDRVFEDEFKLTHEFLGMMLGASRPHVTIIAQQLQRAGLIRYRHGNVTVLDRARLEASACECYHVVASYFDEFLKRLDKSAT